MVTTVKRSTASSPPKKPRRAAAPPTPPPSMVSNVAKQLQAWTGTVLGNMGSAADMALALAHSRAQKPGSKAAVEKASALLRDLRQAAGLSLEDLSHALELDDPSLMGLVESGKVGLPFDVILRMTAVLGRNDPVGFIMQMTRSYSPKTWATLEALGIGKLVVHAGREREFANIYRSHDAARNLSDKDFAAALAFAGTAFATAVAFQTEHAKPEKSPKSTSSNTPPNTTATKESP